MNLLDTLTLFGTVVLGAPVGLLGIEFLLAGRSVAGVGFLAVGIALIAGGYFKPSLTGIAADKVLDVATEPEDADGDGEAYKD